MDISDKIPQNKAILALLIVTSKGCMSQSYCQ